MDGVGDAGAPGADDADIRVLIVDPDQGPLDPVAQAVSALGLSITVVETAPLALAHLTDHPADIVICDADPPGLLGPEFAHALRTLPEGGVSYLLFLTDQADLDAVAKGLNAGADDVLARSAPPQVVQARVRAGARLVRLQRALQDKTRAAETALAEIRALYSAIDRDLAEARKMQQGLLRDRLTQFGAYQVALLLQPSGHVGGDFVGTYPIDADRFVAFAIDVSGHRICSALMTARLAGMFSPVDPRQNVGMTWRDGAYVARPPAETVTELNRLVLEEMQTDLYFTLVLVQVNTKTRQIDLVQAGHPSPMILRAGGQVDPIGVGGLPVGLIPGATYDALRVKLGAQDRLVIVSDGLTEATDAKGRQVEGAGVADLAAKTAGHGTDWLEGVVAAVKRRVGGLEFDDDVSAVLIEPQTPDR